MKPTQSKWNMKAKENIKQKGDVHVLRLLCSDHLFPHPALNSNLGEADACELPFPDS